MTMNSQNVFFYSFANNLHLLLIILIYSVNCLLNETNTTSSLFAEREKKNICLIEGDIVCPVGYNQVSYYLAPIDKNRLWLKRIVPYFIDPSYSESQIDIIKQSVSDIESAICVKFKQLPTQSSDEDYVWIRPIKGCYSFIGRETGSQDLSLTPDCFTSGKGVVIHELIHALGIWHEHTRPDRDDYVEIFFEHIIPETMSNFNKRSKNMVDLLDEPYDYYSIMHYGAYDFSIEPSSLPTIWPYDESVNIDLMGQRDHISQLDEQKLRKLYNCDITHCSALETPLNAIKTINDDNDDHFSVGSTLSFECENGFTLVGSSVRYCRYDGKWSGHETSCVQKLYHYCNFEDDHNEWCAWTQSSDNKFDWQRISGSTPAEDTGPVDDLTYGSSLGHYIYISSSPPQRKGDKSRIKTPSFVSQLSDYVCVSFAYYMWGTRLGYLSLYFSDESGGEKLLWEESGSHGPQWLEVKLAIRQNPLQSFRFIFEGIVGAPKTSDIAIDEVVVFECDQQYYVDMNYKLVNV